MKCAPRHMLPVIQPTIPRSLVSTVVVSLLPLKRMGVVARCPSLVQLRSKHLSNRRLEFD
jgi:hypothetical protein